MNRSPIEWTDFTSNPLQYRDPAGRIVWACIHKSTGCLHCYAETLAHRYGRGQLFSVRNMQPLTPFMSDQELHGMLTYKPASGKRCFVGDMTDLFGEWVPFELLDQLFAVFALRSDVTWQVLTKRPERMLEYMQSRSKSANFWKKAVPKGWSLEWKDMSLVPFPLPNVWLGASVEDQATADERIPKLLQVPGAVLFVSYEPALGSIDWSGFIPRSTTWYPIECRHGFDHCPICDRGQPPFLNWIIIGGESGANARPFNLQWARNVIEQFGRAGVPVFMKQVGSRPIDDYDGVGVFAEYDKRSIQAAADLKMDHVGFTLVLLKDRKGGDPEEWPSSLMVRQFPNGR